jgi:quinate dehydrogenase (quinone)
MVFILGLALLLTGLFYLIGGGKLISLGGSWYFSLQVY